MKIQIILATLIFLLLSCKKEEDTHAGHDIYYTCSMHPQVVSDKPGQCPICHMDLVPVEKNKNADPDALQLTDSQILLGNIKTVRINKEMIADQLTLTGTLNFNQYQMLSESSRVMGRIEKLYYKNLGDYIPKGAALAEIYSEELNNAKQEYILALERRNLFKANTSIDFEQLLQGSKNKLYLWGMSEAQIRNIEKTRKSTPLTTIYSKVGGTITEIVLSEGDYVSEGGTLITVADLSTLWAEAQVFSTQMPLIKNQIKATVYIPDLDNLQIPGKIDFTNPEINPAGRINLVRISVPNRDGVLKPGMPAYVMVKNDSRNSLTLPIDAVIRNGKTTTVWVKTAKNTFKNRMIGIGLEFDDKIEITSGINEGDEVVISGAYLLNSEFVFKKGADPMAGHDMSTM